MARFFGALACVALLLALSSPSYAAAAGFNRKTCTFNGIKLSGRVMVVDSGADIKVQVVSSFPDLKVKTVSSFPDDCGKWQVVTSFPDFTVQFVDHFPDLKIKYVDHFPGV